MTDTREKLLKELQICDFAIHECVLFLDTHPYDEAALAFYQKQLQHNDMLRAEYEKKYGPITYYGNENPDMWEWSEGPWPWQMQETEGE